MSDDRVSAELAAIRDRFDSLAARYPLAEMAAPDRDGLKTHGGHIATSVLDVPRLLAAVEAALTLASALERATGANLVHVERRACGSDLRLAITTALLGQDAPEDGKDETP